MSRSLPICATRQCRFLLSIPAYKKKRKKKEKDQSLYHHPLLALFPTCVLSCRFFFFAKAIIPTSHRRPLFADVLSPQSNVVSPRMFSQPLSVHPYATLLAGSRHLNTSRQQISVRRHSSSISVRCWADDGVRDDVSRLQNDIGIPRPGGCLYRRTEQGKCHAWIGPGCPPFKTAWHSPKEPG